MSNNRFIFFAKGSATAEGIGRAPFVQAFTSFDPYPQVSVKNKRFIVSFEAAAARIVRQ
jgi:hypothetical protein